MFDTPERSRHCSSHVHVSPAPGREFRLSQCRDIAFGVVFYEPLVERLLPPGRRGNRYCRPNTRRSARLSAAVHGGAGAGAGGTSWVLVWCEIMSVGGRADLRNLMQQAGPGPAEADENENDRRVLWNFDNIRRRGGRGTVEFRGGPGLADAAATKRWVAFAVAFVHLCISEVSKRCAASPNFPLQPLPPPPTNPQTLRP